MHRQRTLSPDGSKSMFYQGILFRTYSELDLFEMERINDCIRKKEQIQSIDQEFMLSVFEGHTVFSIYFDQIRVYDAVVQSVQDIVASEDEEADEESSFRRRLFRILTLPTWDVLSHNQDDG